MAITQSLMTGIVTTYHGPTNTRGSRIIADAGQKRRVSVSYEHALSSEENHAAAAQKLCTKFEWSGDLRSGGHSRGFYFVFLDK